MRRAKGESLETGDEMEDGDEMGGKKLGLGVRGMGGNKGYPPIY